MSGFAADPSYEDKVRAVFDEFDVSKARRLTAAAFAGGLQQFSVGLPQGYAEALFARADAKQTGGVGIGEFQKWAADFPTLIDCLYYRAKDKWTLVRMDDDLAGVVKEIAKTMEAVDWAQREVDDAKDMVRDSETAYLDRQNELEEARQSEAEKKDLVQQATNATELSRRVLTEQAAALALARDRERERGVAAQTAQKGVETAAQKLATQQTALRGAEERLMEIERLLEEQRRAVAGHRHAVEEHTIDLQAAEATAADAAAAQAEAATHSAEQADHLSACERNVQEHLSLENTSHHAQREATMDVSTAESKCQQAARTLALKRSIEDQRTRDLLTAKENADAADAKKARLDGDKHAFLEKRQEINAEEQPMIDREVCLFEERSSLEAQEKQLVTDFCDVTRRDVLLPTHVAALPPKRAIQEISGASPRRSRSAAHVDPTVAAITAGPGGLDTPTRGVDAAARDEGALQQRGISPLPAAPTASAAALEHRTPPRCGRPGSSTNPLPDGGRQLAATANTSSPSRQRAAMSPPVVGGRRATSPTQSVSTEPDTPPAGVRVPPGANMLGSTAPPPVGGISAYVSMTDSPQSVSTSQQPLAALASHASLGVPSVPVNSPAMAQPAAGVASSFEKWQLTGKAAPSLVPAGGRGAGSPAGPPQGYRPMPSGSLLPGTPAAAVAAASPPSSVGTSAGRGGGLLASAYAASRHTASPPMHAFAPATPIQVTAPMFSTPPNAHGASPMGVYGSGAPGGSLFRNPVPPQVPVVHQPPQRILGMADASPGSVATGMHRNISPTRSSVIGCI